jgi:peptidoglycan/xylan/chitin deacetylase (PgdA/CDA1 family)
VALLPAKSSNLTAKRLGVPSSPARWLRAILKQAWMFLLYSFGFLRRAKKRIAARGGVVVLTFHRVLDDAECEGTSSPDGMIVRRQTFESLARCVASHYETLRLDGEAPVWTSAGNAPRIAFTFDDGWADNAHNAFPIAQRFGIPFTILICPGYVGKLSPFWPERVVALWRAAEKSSGAALRIAELIASTSPGASTSGAAHTSPSLDSALAQLKQLPAPERERLIAEMEQIAAGAASSNPAGDSPDACMPWRDVIALAKGGVTFGSHTQTHEILPRTPLAETKRQLDDSKQSIQQNLGRECLLFAYPNGDCSSEVRDAVAAAGYRFAFLNHPGIWTKDTDPFLIPRFNIWEGKLVSPFGRFSRISFEYTAFWKTI